MQKGKIFFVSGPSGVGKGTLIKALKERHPEWVFPPSFSTRSMRPGETQGDPYFFIEKNIFEKKISRDEFLEYALVHGTDFYGTERDSLLTPAKRGNVVIKEFDIQGFEQARKRLPKDAYTAVFLNVHGGVDELIRRIQERSPMSHDELQHRIASMTKELAMEKAYDYTVYNDEIETMVGEVEGIIAKEMGAG